MKYPSRLPSRILGALALCGTLFPVETFLKMDYEDRHLSSESMGVNAECPAATNALTLSDTYARSGHYSLRTLVDRKDEYISAGKHRAETDAMKNKAAQYKPGDARRYQFSVLLDPSWGFSKTAAVDIIWQWKRTSGSPDMFVGVKRNAIVLRHPKGQENLVKECQPGVWMDLAFEITWSTGDDGKVNCWARSATHKSLEPVATVTGPNIDANRVNQGSFGYLKWGLYRPDSDVAIDIHKPRIIYHDDILVTDITISLEP